MPPAHQYPDARLLAAIATGGVVGSLGRYCVGLALPHPAGGWPWSTLTVNLTGALMMGLLVEFLVARPGAHRLARPFLAVGALGGWTTFSTFAVDVIQQSHAGHGGLAAAYVIGSVVASVAGVAVGSVVGQRIWEHETEGDA
ncbi:MAG: CrcB family protein [Nostocoides sp.]